MFLSNLLQFTMYYRVFAFIFVFAMVSADTSTERPHHMKGIHEKCNSDPSTYIDKEILDTFRQGGEATDPNLAKHILCMHVEEGIQSRNGDIILDELEEVLGKAPGRNKEKVDEIISKCGTRTSTNAEEAAIGLSKCLQQYKPEQSHHAHRHHHH